MFIIFIEVLIRGKRKERNQEISKREMIHGIGRDQRDRLADKEKIQMNHRADSSIALVLHWDLVN